MHKNYDLISKDSEFPNLFAQELEQDPTVYIKLFTPWSSWMWLLTEHDRKHERI